MSLQTNNAFTIGVEEEYQIIDPQSRELSQSAHEIYPLAHDLLGDAVQYEMILSQIEIATPICHTLADVQAELIRLRGGIIAAADQTKKLIAAGGTHPFSHWKEQTITPKARYEDLISTYQQLIREQIIFGCHVHVGFPDREVAMQVANRARLWLAPLIALTANSPFWLGENTGYQDYRTGLWWTVPLSGPPPYFASYKHYRAAIQELLDTHSIEDPTKIYWDLRLSERFPTIEFRVMDVCITVNETVTVAGLVRALVRTCYKQVINHTESPQSSTDFLRTLHWRAARYGLDEMLVDVLTQRCLPAREYVEEFLAFLRPELEAEGDWYKVARGVRSILEHGNGATRQLAVFQKNGNLTSVVDYLVAETRDF
jgi:carboxylate-amine ligase, YbdK family